jgi:hypothetical protein
MSGSSTVLYRNKQQKQTKIVLLQVVNENELTVPHEVYSKLHSEGGMFHMQPRWVLVNKWVYTASNIFSSFCIFWQAYVFCVASDLDSEISISLMRL